MGTGRAYGLNRMRVAGVIALVIVVIVLVWLVLGGAAVPRLRRCDISSYADDTLELDLKKCSLTTLPSLARFTRLRKLDLGHNASHPAGSEAEHWPTTRKGTSSGALHCSQESPLRGENTALAAAVGKPVPRYA